MDRTGRTIESARPSSAEYVRSESKSQYGDGQKNRCGRRQADAVDMSRSDGHPAVHLEQVSSFVSRLRVQIRRHGAIVVDADPFSRQGGVGEQQPGRARDLSGAKASHYQSCGRVDVGQSQIDVRVARRPVPPPIVQPNPAGTEDFLESMSSRLAIRQTRLHPIRPCHPV